MTAVPLAAARILLVIGGGIAAYKSLELIRRLRDRGAAVQVVMTDSARQFITPLSAATLSGQPVRDALFNLTDESLIGHIELSRSADLVVVAPATANLLARMAGGLADDLATTLLLATDKPVLVAPAMNVRMWLHPATQRNIERLGADGVAFAGPDEGPMACGEFGPGRMAEPAAIVDAIERALSKTADSPERPSLLAGRRVIVTSGPTYEPIDPVRFIGNRSSGRQGHAIAQSAVGAGANVILVTGPVALPDPPGATVVHVETALEMQAAVAAALPADAFIAAAAVADWRVERVDNEKIKKGEGGAPTLRLVENPDILAEVAKMNKPRPAVVIGFAAETNHLVDNAKSKLLRKGCDFIIGNSVASGTTTFGGETNEVLLIGAEGVERWPSMSKAAVADRLVAKLAVELAKRS
ncbi:phosphopantothenoylcysteine decarboxylase/phosphopantothenate--cysteine ligase [Roseiarcus fermentans]|uniref:Coenzyme A biosynthesis bifunctional protein CoaBC n=1 Tax=Roseiarcus fermentans TaxID=1473586 RepID=A0A366F3V4_9HYPH|nr:bifunctional phosphopantothenoylcysteine decarboxylase/phosphopantothenate--cysteine ligase CoaBC [Roseiarcus fermentans]RBP08660.1 phosphopantothenoylcysteine decarboxylase/phosphopantothenate--cysteine ligase [Roseiarcus fermentans]